MIPSLSSLVRTSAQVAMRRISCALGAQPLAQHGALDEQREAGGELLERRGVELRRRRPGRGRPAGSRRPGRRPRPARRRSPPAHPVEKRVAGRVAGVEVGRRAGPAAAQQLALEQRVRERAAGAQLGSAPRAGRASASGTSCAVGDPAQQQAVEPRRGAASTGAVLDDLADRAELRQPGQRVAQRAPGWRPARRSAVMPGSPAGRRRAGRGRRPRVVGVAQLLHAADLRAVVVELGGNGNDPRSPRPRPPARRPRAAPPCAAARGSTAA